MKEEKPPNKSMMRKFNEEEIATVKNEIRYLKNRLATIEGWTKRVSESAVINL